MFRLLVMMLSWCLSDFMVALKDRELVLVLSVLKRSRARTEPNLLVPAMLDSFTNGKLFQKKNDPLDSREAGRSNEGQ